MTNPFSYPNPVPPNGLIDRSDEIRRIASRILSDGQSSALTGEPRSGKTSLLGYLASPETRADLYGADSRNLFFKFIDGQTLGSQFTKTQFWETVLQPLYETAAVPELDSALTVVFEHCRKSGFDAPQLEALFAQMCAGGRRLVLLLDEFDALLNHPILHSPDFYGTLRSLVSRGKGALALVIASRNSLAALNEATRALSRDTSPYFNFLVEVPLRQWPTNAVGQLLDRAAGRFSREDRLFITAIAGEQPYLLQVAAYETWQAHEEGETETEQREQTVGKRVYAEVTPTLDDIWRRWSPQTKMAFTIIALPQIASVQRQFRGKHLEKELQYFGPELKLLKERGWIAEDASMSTGWRVRPQVFLWWLADEVVRNVRDESTFEEWLRNQKLEGIMTRGQKEQLEKTGRAIGGILTGGVRAFIEAASKGLGEGLGKQGP